MYIHGFQHHDIYYCRGCGYFFHKESDKLVDIFYTELSADFALQVMQDRQKGFATCHLKQRAKPRKRCRDAFSGKEVKNIIYRGRGISCWQIDRYNYKTGENESAWICRHDNCESVASDFSELIARVKNYIDWRFQSLPETDNFF